MKTVFRNKTAILFVLVTLLFNFNISGLKAQQKVKVQLSSQVGRTMDARVACRVGGDEQVKSYYALSNVDTTWHVSNLDDRLRTRGGTEAKITEEAISEEIVTQSRTEAEGSITSNAQVEGQYGAYSGSAKFYYATDYASSGERYYAYKRFGKRYYTISLSELVPVLEPNIQNDLNGTMTPAEFFDKYGTHVVTKIYTGGFWIYSKVVTKNASKSSTEVEAQLKAEYDALVASGSCQLDAAVSEKSSTYFSEDKTLIESYGSLLNPNDKNYINDLKTKGVVVDFDAIPLWDYCTNADRKAAFQNEFTKQMIERFPEQALTLPVMAYKPYYMRCTGDKDYMSKHREMPQNYDPTWWEQEHPLALVSNSLSSTLKPEDTFTLVPVKSPASDVESNNLVELAGVVPTPTIKYGDRVVIKLSGGEYLFSHQNPVTVLVNSANNVIGIPIQEPKVIGQNAGLVLYGPNEKNQSAHNMIFTVYKFWSANQGYKLTNIDDATGKDYTGTTVGEGDMVCFASHGWNNDLQKPAKLKSLNQNSTCAVINEQSGPLTYRLYSDKTSAPTDYIATPKYRAAFKINFENKAGFNAQVYATWVGLDGVKFEETSTTKQSGEKWSYNVPEGAKDVKFITKYSNGSKWIQIWDKKNLTSNRTFTFLGTTVINPRCE